LKLAVCFFAHIDDQLQRLLKEKVDVEDLALDFTIPGYDIELRVIIIYLSAKTYRLWLNFAFVAQWKKH
jgi:hypothetical protein